MSERDVQDSLKFMREKLRKERKAQNMSQLTLSAEADLACNTICRIEKGTAEPGIGNLLRLTDALHILSELHQLATSYGILHNGQLLEQLTAEELDARCSKYLLVRTDNDRRAVDILRKMFPEAICQATVEGLRLFPVGNEAAATASGVLMENGLHVQELAVRSEGLEAYFTALVGGDSHADAG